MHVDEKVLFYLYVVKRTLLASRMSFEKLTFLCVYSIKLFFILFLVEKLFLISFLVEEQLF